MAVRITIEMFSGRPDPCWEVGDPDRFQQVRELLARKPQARGAVDSGYTGLGFRGVRVDCTGSDTPLGLPASFELAGGGAPDPVASAELAQALVDTIPPDLAEGGGITIGNTSYADLVRETALQEIERTLHHGSHETSQKTSEAQREAELPDGWKEQMRALDARAPACGFDSEMWAPDYWNHPTIQPRNNCYAYGVAYKSDTFAVPGKYHGYTIPPAMLTDQVAMGCFKDGLVDFGYPCRQGTRRFLVVLCTGAYSSGFRDFHFYRYHVEGFWSHKRAGNPARFVDASGYVIRDPGVCDRDIYTELYPRLLQSHDSVRIS
ncbi:hypothetical protein ACFXB3_10325 [Streptomyces sp. NPDC059447]|uniref:hypothetical protein n=1 Tax=Streptomyces sp. NPDC059447 TaxID=3346834 RepID=UPI0036C58A0F